ncbi:MAG: FAD-dependent oxidoreductase, partial [Myxococcales bacterium]|nr:FAD-dependent oxidoreductase [Myxococcales bacterium]
MREEDRGGRGTSGALEVAIIGAGFAGLAAARRLAQLRPQDTVVILEARAVAEGPAGRNSGFMIDLPH